MGLRTLAVKLAVGLLACLVTAASVSAQTYTTPEGVSTPAPVSVVDGNGVNLATGVFTPPSPTLSIGTVSRLPSESADANGYSDNNSGSVRGTCATFNQNNGSCLEVGLTFSVMGGSYLFKIPIEQMNSQTAAPAFWQTGLEGTYKAKLTCTPIYTDANAACTLKLTDGTVAIYAASEQMALTTVVRPDGEVISYNYYLVNGINKGIKTVSSSLGWSMKYERDANSNYKLVRVVGVNTAVDYCDPTAVTCSTTTLVESTEGVSGNTTTISQNGTSLVSYTKTVDANGTGNYVVTSLSGVSKTVNVTANKVTSVSMAGSTWTYVYSQPQQSLTRSMFVTAPDGTTSSTVTDGQNVTQTIDAFGNVTSYTYGAFNNITRIESPDATKDANNNLTGGYTDYEYDSLGRLISTKIYPKNGGSPIVTSATYTVACDATNEKYCRKPLTTTSADGVVTTYTYDAVHGGILTETLPAVSGIAPQTRYAYKQVTPQIKGPSNTVVNQAPVWRLVETSSCMKFNWDATVGLCKNTDGNTYAWDELKTVIDYGPETNGVIISTNNVQPLSQTVKNGVQTATYGSMVTSASNAAKATSYALYNYRGQVKESWSKDEGSTDVAYRSYALYDGLGRTIGVIEADPDGTGTRPRMAKKVVYDASGRVEKEMTGTVTGTALADLNAMTVVETHVNEFSPTTGLPIRAKYYAGTDIAANLKNVSERSYDTMFRVTCEAQRMNSSLFSGLTSTAPNACAVTTPEATDGPDRITKIERTYEMNGSSRVGYFEKVKSAVGTPLERTDVTKHYTRYGQLDYVTDAKGNKTSYSYDDLNRIKKTCYPTAASGGTPNQSDCETITYSGVRVSSVLLRDQTNSISFLYDGLGRVNYKMLNGTSYMEYFSYDNFSNVRTHINYLYNGNSGAASGSGALMQGVFTYTTLGWLISENQTEYTAGGTATQWNKTVVYYYDNYGRRVRAKHPSEGTENYFVSYAYNQGDEITRICENAASCAVAASPTVTFGYNNIGIRTSLNRANGKNTTYGFDTQYQLTQLAHTGTVTTDFAYNTAGQTKSRTVSNTAYKYAPTIETVAYMANGLNQVTDVNGTSITYDMRGNLTSDGGGTYTFNANNLLTQATQSGVATNLAYDSENRLLSVSKNGVTTRYVYDGVDLIAEYAANADGSFSILRRYVHGPGDDEPLVWLEKSGTTYVKYFLHADELGSIVQVTDTAGVTKAINTYDEYGIPATTASQFAGAFRYTGQRYLPEIGMYYYKARLYNPVLGRFLQTDPIGYGDGMNWYNYVGADPMNGTDPTGLCDTRGGQCDPRQGGIGSCDASAGCSSSYISGSDYAPGITLFVAIKEALGFNSAAAPAYGIPEITVVGKRPVFVASRAGMINASSLRILATLRYASVAGVIGWGLMPVQTGCGDFSDRCAIQTGLGNIDSAEHAESAEALKAAVIHGNSKRSQKTTYVYRLVFKDGGGIAKIGISANPKARYSSRLLEMMGVRIETIGVFSNRINALIVEQSIILEHIDTNNCAPAYNYLEQGLYMAGPC